MKTILAENLRFLRKQNVLTLNDLASILDVSKSAISDYENEKTPLSVSVVLAYCKYFDVSISKIIQVKFNQEQYLNGNYKEKMDTNEQVKDLKSKWMLCKQKVEALTIQNKLQTNILESKESEITALKMQIKLMNAMK